MTDRKKTGKSAGFAEESARYSTPVQGLRASTEIGRDGRIVIPAAMREAMGAKEGTKLILLMEGETLEIFTVEAGIRRAQAIVREFVPAGVSLADELIADRRREAEEEDND